jgi:hypothetical protein
MVATNKINLSQAGIVNYDGAGSFTSAGNPLLVTNGGTQIASNTAFAVLCGGTTNTGPVQNVSSLGTLGQLLVSNGANNLPTFQTKVAQNGGYILQMVCGGVANPADGSTYFFALNNSITTETASIDAVTRISIPVDGTITKVYGTISVAGTLGSSGNSTLSMRLNNSSDTTITSTLALTAAINNFSNTGLSVAVVAGDYIETKIVTPTWSTNPTNVGWSIFYLVT